jgi:hypothetical protein
MLQLDKDSRGFGKTFWLSRQTNSSNATPFLSTPRFTEVGAKFIINVWTPIRNLHRLMLVIFYFHWCRFASWSFRLDALSYLQVMKLKASTYFLHFGAHMRHSDESVQ